MTGRTRRICSDTCHSIMCDIHSTASLSNSFSCPDIIFGTAKEVTRSANVV